MISILSLFLLLQISFCRKEKSLKIPKNTEIYQFHDRIDDDKNLIFIKQAIFSNFKNNNINGGAIYINKNRLNCTLTNCQFNNCAGKLGGAIYIKSANHNDPHSCSIYNALFTNCQAINGGALYLRIGKTESHSISIEGCTFKFNIAIENGGAIYGLSREKLAIQRCKFDDNEAGIKGSSIWCSVGQDDRELHHKLILYRNSFIFTANEHNLVNVYIESSNITSSQIPNSNAFIGLCSFSSKNDSFIGYKNIEVVEKGKFESFNFTECNCIQGPNDTVSINTDFDDSFLLYDCESIDQCNEESVFQPIPNATDECNEYPNRQDYVGGSGVEFEKACFSNFRSPILQDGGAIHVINAQVDLETCTFTNCSTDGNGGALFVILSFLDCEIEIEECIFDSCSAAENGGAVYVYVSENNNELEVDATICQLCNSGENGGAFYIFFNGKNCNLEFEESIFDSNIAKNEGGAIYFVSKAASRSTFEELEFVNNTASNAGAFYYSPFSYSKLCRSDFFNNTCTGENSSSSMYLVINPNTDEIRSKIIKNFADDYENGQDEDDNETQLEDDDEYDDAQENIKEDTFDNMTIRNVALNDNIFKCNPIHNSTQVTIKMLENAILSLGKNSFSFNGKDEEAEQINSNYLNIIQNDNSNISFRFDGFICFDGNSTNYDVGIDNIEPNCPIVKLNPDLDGESNKGSKEQKKKIILISGIVIGCVAVVAIITVSVLVVVNVLKGRNLKQYSTNLNNGGDSIISNISQETNEKIIPQL